MGSVSEIGINRSVVRGTGIPNYSTIGKDHQHDYLLSYG